MGGLGRVVKSLSEARGIISKVEITRNPEQEEGSIPAAYWLNSAEVRLAFVEGIENRNNLRDEASFTRFVTYLHMIAASGKEIADARFIWHAQAPEKAERYYYSGTIGGELRDLRFRKPDTYEIVREALKADGFPIISMSGRDAAGKTIEVLDKHGVKSGFRDVFGVNPLGLRKKLVLPGISGGGCPANSKKTHVYPADMYVHEYMEAARKSFLEFLSVGWGPERKAEAVRKIAKFFQYAINGRPFGNINNSMFMNMVGAMLRMHGLKGISHGILDHMAHRLEPAAFEKVFLFEVEKWNPGEIPAGDMNTEDVMGGGDTSSEDVLRRIEEKAAKEDMEIQERIKNTSSRREDEILERIKKKVAREAA